MTIAGDSRFNSQFSTQANTQAPHQTIQETVIELDGNTLDAMEAYFSCITTCSLDDGSCITQCVEEFREHH
jgi:hypothetical protein